MKVRLLLLAIVFLSVTLAAKESLVLVKDLGDSRDDFPVIEIVEGQYIVLAQQDHLDLLKTRNIQFGMLDENVAGKDYFLVYPFKNTPFQSISYTPSVFENYGTVLACFEKCLLMQSTDLTLHSMVEYKVQLDYLELEPIEFGLNNMAPSALQRKTVRYNPDIEKMLKMVSPDSVEAFERKLCAFHTRHAKSKTSKDEVMPWFKEIFKEYGCDSVVELPISGCSPAVLGIRFGTKDPTLKQFTLLGGHNDNIISGASADTRHQGANDNATGTVAVLEAARVHQHFKFDYTIVYCAFNAEELGLYGSSVIMKALKNAGCKAIGGLFSFDMFGMSKVSMKFSAYTGVAGASEFVDQMKQIKELYKLTQPATITTTSNGSPPTDSRNIWRNGYQGIVHNFATGGSGSIHSSDDVIKSTYDKEFQAECAKLGIATTAEQAMPQPTSIHTKTNAYTDSFFKYAQTADAIVFTFDGNKKMLSSGKVDIYDLHGRLIVTLKADNVKKRIVWDRKTSDGTSVAAHSVLVVKYSDMSTTSLLKMVVK